MENLIDSFQKESSLTLLFLRNVKKLFIHTENENKETACMFVEHALDNECDDKRREFYIHIRDLQPTIPAQNICCGFRSSMTLGRNDKIVDTENWVIVNLFKGKKSMSKPLKALITDESLSYCPLVSIAVRRSPSKETHGNLRLGHVFCFLPLPLQSESLTGLPVHVNGFFALSQNRRHVKWPSSENQENNDKSIQWNQHLCNEVLVDAYVEIIDMLKDITTEDGRTSPDENIVYCALPNIFLVHSHWSVILDPFYNILFDKDIFFTENDGGKWIPRSEAIFSIFDWRSSNQTDTRTIEDDVLEVLYLYKKNIVLVPEHLKVALLRYCPNSQKICPGFVRHILKSDDCYKQISRIKRMHLLEFVISDAETYTKDLENLELLPLKDGTFVSFNNDSQADRIYLCSEKNEHTFFPKLEHKFADFDVEQEQKKRIENLVMKGNYYNI